VTKEGLTEAEGLFRKALELDPKLARAYYGLATVRGYLIDLGLAPSVEEALSKTSTRRWHPDEGGLSYRLAETSLGTPFAHGALSGSGEALALPR
jgi:hypothetical protein